jgi:hypothetical protein
VQELIAHINKSSLTEEEDTVDIVFSVDLVDPSSNTGRELSKLVLLRALALYLTLIF